MRFIDRTRELGRLSALSARRDGGLAVLWGKAAPGEDAPPARVGAAPRRPVHHRGPVHGRSPAALLRRSAHRVSEIAGRLGQPATSLARPIGRLVDLGLVRRDRPHGDPEKGAKRALCRIADPFCRMWFQTVAPHRALLAQAPRKVRLALREE